MADGLSDDDRQMLTFVVNEAAMAVAVRDRVGQFLAQKYKIGPKDHIDSDSGAIVRASEGETK